MRFVSVELFNWGPYRGEHKVDLSSPNGGPLVLLFGENGRGKTSLAKAIKWCLYENQSKVDPLAMANRQLSLTEDEFEVGVRLVFERAQDTTVKTFELSRYIKVKQDARGTFGIRQLSASKSLVMDGTPIVPALIDKTIIRLAPLEMSSFLLFDGEELKRTIEDLGGNEQVSVRARIESTMGLTALSELEESLSTEVRAIEKRVKIKSKYKALDAEIDALTAEVSRLKFERSDLAKDRGVQELKAEQLRRELEKFESFTATIKLLEDREKSFKIKKAELANKREDIVQSLKTAWWLPLGDRIEARQKRELQRQQDSKTRDSLQALEEILKTRRCEVCNAEHSDLEPIRAKIRELQSQLTALEDSEETSLSFSEMFQNVAVRKTQIEFLFQDERELIREVKDLESDVIRFRAELVDIDQESHNSLLSEFQLATKSCERLTVELEKIEIEIGKQESELSSKRRERAKMEDVPADDEAQQIALLQMGEIVRNLRDNLANKVRQEVEDVASFHYKRMMDNPDIIGVRITPDYSIRAVHRTLGEKPFSSFGQSLIYVYAFVAALIEVSDLPNSWLIDTVGSRLDQTKMKAVWLWLAERQRQIIAMPHSNELTPDQAREWMFNSISRMYEIVPNELQDSDSRIEEITA